MRDLAQLQSIFLGSKSLEGAYDTKESNSLIMATMSNTDWLNRSSSLISSPKEITTFGMRNSDTEKWWLMILCEIDLTSLTRKQIRMKAFYNANQLVYSMTDEDQDYDPLGLFVIKMSIHKVFSYLINEQNELVFMRHPFDKYWWSIVLLSFVHYGN